MRRIREAQYVDDEEQSVIIDYEQERMDDVILKDIKHFCFDYLSGKHDIGLNELYNMKNFVQSKFDFVIKFKESMRLGNYSWPFTSIAQTLDLIVMEQNLDSDITESSKRTLEKETSNLMENLGLYFAIIDNAIREKEDIK